ncbi:MAG: PASTA domain-containing protein [Candidatus Kapaibacterium sp.]|nr:MAG: PASTA domain-containing protein [Candidatus Kapabacteria bacterium]
METSSTDITTPFVRTWQRMRGFVHSLEERITRGAETELGKDWRRYIFRIFALLCGIAFVVGAFDLVFMPWYVGHDQITRMPDVRNMSFTQAAKMLEERGFTVKTASEYYNNSVPAGHIVSQMPFPLSMVKSSRTVYLTLSRGKQLLEMPNLVGLSVRDARIALIRLGLSLNNAAYEFNENVAANVIFEQSVKTKERLNFGATVDVRVSLGPEIVLLLVPDVEGKSLEDAKNMLVGAGLTIGDITPQVDETFVTNTVLKQNPAPNDSVKTGTAVNLIVAK